MPQRDTGQGANLVRTGASGSDSAQPSLLAAQPSLLATQPRLGFFLLMMAATSLSGGKRQT